MGVAGCPSAIANDSDRLRAETESGEAAFAIVRCRPNFPNISKMLAFTRLMMLRRMRRDEITAHGFRSTFSDWASEVSSFSGELGETALTHTIKNKAERAYRHGDALEKRREMMDAWAKYCDPATDCVPARAMNV